MKVSKINKIPTPPSFLRFFLPIIMVLFPFVLLNLGCQPGVGTTTGSLKLLYTSEVGGRLDPCG